MSLIFKGGGFIHVPRTGGRFVEKYIGKVLNGKIISKFPKHHTKEINGKVFVCVRHPVRYVESYFYLMTTTQWQWVKNKTPDVDLNGFRGRTIDDFVDNLALSPGCILEYLESFHVGDVVVGRTESLENDLNKFMTDLGYSYSENIRNMENTWKTSKKDGFLMSNESKTKLIKSEYKLIEKYYSDFST